MALNATWSIQMEGSSALTLGLVDGSTPSQVGEFYSL